MEQLRLRCDHYTAVETIPHFPPLPGIFYLHPPLPPADGTALATLLQRFRPA